MRPLLTGALLIVLLLPCSAAVQRSQEYHQGALEPGANHTRVAALEAGDEASAVVIGKNARSLMGLYVFDEYGNCLARDDQGRGKNPDDLAVEWVAAQTGRYSIELHNLSLLANGYEMALRHRRLTKGEK